MGLDAVLLTTTSGVAYATGVAGPVVDPGLASVLRPVALACADASPPVLFSPHEHPDATRLGVQLEPGVEIDTEEGVVDLARRLAERLGGRNLEHGRIGVDDATPAMRRGLDGALTRLGGRIELVDAGHALGAARLRKTLDELACIRMAQRANEAAIAATWPLVAPGTRASELTARFSAEARRLGVHGSALDPIWQVMPTPGREASWTTTGGLAFPLVAADRILREGDVVWVDTGLVVHGYVSDYGATWPVSISRRPSVAQANAFARWCEVVAAVVERIAPGVRGIELVEAATKAAGGERPWPPHFYLAHGIGLESAEGPLVGTDLGPEADHGLVLEPGMVLVLEPELFDDEGGFRGEVVVAVTEGGCTLLSSGAFWPFEEAA